MESEQEKRKVVKGWKEEGDEEEQEGWSHYY